MDYQSLLQEVESWPVETRIQFVNDVWDRLPDPDDQVELSEEFKAELDRRIKEFDENPSARVSFEVAEAEALARIRK